MLERRMDELIAKKPANSRYNRFYFFLTIFLFFGCCRLENELQELERRYQDQRKKLIADLHAERESMEREKDSMLLERERELERRFAQREKELEKSWTEKEKLATEKLAAIEANYKVRGNKIRVPIPKSYNPQKRWK